MPTSPRGCGAGAEESKAADNRIAFGRPKKAKTLQQRRKALEVERHEGHRLERDEPAGARQEAAQRVFA